MANIEDVRDLAETLMTKHGVGYVSFGFDNAKSRLGYTQCRRERGGPWIPYRVTLSRHFVELLPIEELTKTILHEIAHCLTPGDGHGAQWRRAAFALGISQDRCAKPSARPERPITSVCTNCGEAGNSFHRLPTTVKYHLPCGVKDGVFSFVKNGQTVDVRDMPMKYRDTFRQLARRGIINA